MNQKSEPFHLLLEDDDDVIHKYRITESDYNKYEKDGIKWITFYCRAGIKESPEDDMPPQLWLEINLPIEAPEFPTLHEGSKLTGKAYDHEKYFNLTNVYCFSHDGFEDPIIEIIEKKGKTLKARITGESVVGPITLLSNFTLNPQRTRSFK